jgi:predicted Fe-S protein YdhL (DUF1289 family)
MPALEPVASPCNKICRLDERQVCVGCGRTLDEIAEWSAAGESRRREIVERCAQRLRAMPPPDQGLSL